MGAKTSRKFSPSTLGHYHLSCPCWKCIAHLPVARGFLFVRCWDSIVNKKDLASPPRVPIWPGGAAEDQISSNYSPVG